MPKPPADHVDLDARFQQVDGGSMAEQMRGDPSCVRPRRVEGTAVPTNDLVDSVAAQCLALTRTEYDTIRLPRC